MFEELLHIRAVSIGAILALFVIVGVLIGIDRLLINHNEMQLHYESHLHDEAMRRVQEKINA